MNKDFKKREITNLELILRFIALILRIIIFPIVALFIIFGVFIPLLFIDLNEYFNL